MATKTVFYRSAVYGEAPLQIDPDTTISESEGYGYRAYTYGGWFLYTSVLMAGILLDITPSVVVLLKTSPKAGIHLDASPSVTIIKKGA